MSKLLNNILDDIRVELLDKFDQNFETKSFFKAKWKPTLQSNYRGSLLMRSGKLRNSIKGTSGAKGVRFTSSMPYAALHNQGGEIKVTARMKAYFWYMHLKLSNKSTSSKTKKYSTRYNVEAEQWKALALKKVGSVIKVEQRQFLGWHESLGKVIEGIVLKNVVQELERLKP